ncbi:MAG: putative lipid II flippase FtsW [Epsilonproteobacteria bacterium]|nr:putative lipid II flippase FtsW [Campylobacterota bacterium]
MAVPRSVIKYHLYTFLMTALFLVLVGFVFIYSASSVYALEKFGSAHYFLKKQSVYFCIGLISFVFCSRVPFGLIKRSTPLLFFAALVLTGLTLVPSLGAHCHGSSRWLNVFGFSFQPSEFLKVFFFMYIGFFLDRKYLHIRSFVQSYVPFIAILGVTFLLLLKQPDFGSVVTMFSTSIMIFFIARFQFAHLFVTLVASVPVLLYLIVSRSYRLHRILIFLNPWSDPRGRGFQIIQSLIAIGSGHIWGLGIANSKQKFFYLPMQHTDFIFSIIAEETGFAGSVILLLLYFVLCFSGLRLALQLKDPFQFFTTLGFVLFITLQAGINLMVASGMLPTKGLGLPFVSYGGTALIALCMMAGLITNFVRTHMTLRSF